MNPQTIKNPLDRAKMREQYLSNLRLQASNDQKNQNANMIFKNTGVTPSRPPDTRTTTEKASDIEALKVDLRSKLSQVTDGFIASQIIGELSADQIRFAIDKWGVIEADMKKIFTMGVPANAFIAYLNRLIEKFNLTEGVETGLQQFSGNSILMSNTQILYGLPRGQIWETLKGVLDKARRQFGIDITPLLREIGTNISLIPTNIDQEKLNQLPPELKADILVILNRMFNNVASNAEIADLIQDISVGLANRDKRYTEQAISKGIELLALDDSVLDDRADLISILEQFFRPTIAPSSTIIDEIGISPAEETAEQFITPEAGLPEVGTIPQPAQNVSENQIYETQPRMISRKEWDALGTRKKEAKALFINARLFLNPDLVIYLTTKGRKQPYSYPKRIADSNKLTNADLDSLYESYIQETQMGMSGNGVKMCGSGLVKTPKQRVKIDKPYRQSIAHLIDKPVEKVKPYTQFGRYFINKHRLEGEGIVAFRQPSGNTIASLPTEKVSKPLAKVIKTLVGKGVPSFEDISDLSKEDRVKLHHICKNCKVESPAIPNPKMKGEGEAEEDRFNILRGEIIAGNDNAKIAKEFKAMLLKFMNEGRIPKRQANEILQELLLLGH